MTEPNDRDFTNYHNIVSLPYLFYWKKTFQKRRQTNTSTISETDKFTSLQFSLDHAEQTLNKGEYLYPFAMTMSNNCVDTDYYNFENKEIPIESIETQLKESKTDMDLIWIVSNDAKISRLEIQSFLKGIKKSPLLSMSYKIINQKYQIDRQNFKIVKEQHNFLNKD